MLAPDRRAPGQPEPHRPLTLLDLGLRGPTLGVIQRQGVFSVAQLTQMTPEDLVGMRRVGLTRMMEIRQALQSHGLDLKTDAPTPPVRVWEVSRRVRLSCCDTGDCALELRTSGTSPAEVAQLVTAFVAIHRACPRLAGREPVVTTVETTRPGAASFAIRPAPQPVAEADEPEPPTPLERPQSA